MWKRTISFSLFVALIILAVILRLPVAYHWLVIPFVVGELLLLGWAVQQWVITPVQQLTETIERISDGDLSSRIFSRSTDEVGTLIHVFNQMNRIQSDRIELLSDERELLNAVFSQMSDGVIATNSAGIVTICNETSLQLLKIKVEKKKIIGRTLAEMVRHHQLIELWQRCSETQEPISDIVDLNQSELFLQCNIVPLSGQPLRGYLILLHDLTTVRRLETVRRDFISNLSHELRTPLASLRAVIETLQDGALKDPPAAERFLNRAAIEIDTLTQMVSELLELSRIESGKVPFKFAPVKIEKIVEEVMEKLLYQAVRKETKIDVDIAPNLPELFVDYFRIEQVLSNLLHNAIKFAPDQGGVITIKAEVYCEQGQKSDFLQISVRDNGIGIPEQDIDRIFERFYKTDRARTSRGTGLGLAIAKHIVQVHQGKIVAKSREGKGSIFWFTLPTVNQILEP